MKKPRLPSKKRVLLLTTGVLVVILVGLPFLAGTKSYPIAVVEGNSMYPHFSNGELVIFAAPRAPIQNGTIIVFVQGSSGIPALDSFLKPIVIHRVVGMGTEPNGMPYYETKGDNNQQKDPFVTDADQVLGVPVLAIPYAGLPILFLQSPYGLVAVVAVISLIFFSGVDTHFEQERRRNRLIAIFARRSLNGEISSGDFEKLKLTIEYYNSLNVDQLMNPTIISLADWLREGGLGDDWKEDDVPCPMCSGPSVRIAGKSKLFSYCPACSNISRANRAKNHN